MFAVAVSDAVAIAGVAGPASAITRSVAAAAAVATAVAFTAAATVAAAVACTVAACVVVALVVATLADFVNHNQGHAHQQKERRSRD